MMNTKTWLMAAVAGCCAVAPVVCHGRDHGCGSLAYRAIGGLGAAPASPHPRLTADPLPVPFLQIAVGLNGYVYGLSTDQKLYWYKPGMTGPGVVVAAPSPEPIVGIAALHDLYVITANAVYTINVDTGDNTTRPWLVSPPSPIADVVAGGFAGDDYLYLARGNQIYKAQATTITVGGVPQTKMMYELIEAIYPDGAAPTAALLALTIDDNNLYAVAAGNMLIRIEYTSGIQGRHAQIENVPGTLSGLAFDRGECYLVSGTNRVSMIDGRLLSLRMHDRISAGDAPVNVAAGQSIKKINVNPRNGQLLLMNTAGVVTLYGPRAGTNAEIAVAAYGITGTVTYENGNEEPISARMAGMITKINIDTITPDSRLEVRSRRRDIKTYLPGGITGAGVGGTMAKLSLASVYMPIIDLPGVSIKQLNCVGSDVRDVNVAACVKANFAGGGLYGNFTCIAGDLGSLVIMDGNMQNARVVARTQIGTIAVKGSLRNNTGKVYNTFVRCLKIVVGNPKCISRLVFGTSVKNFQAMTSYDSLDEGPFFIDELDYSKIHGAIGSVLGWKSTACFDAFGVCINLNECKGLTYALENLDPADVLQQNIFKIINNQK